MQEHFHGQSVQHDRFSNDQNEILGQIHLMSMKNSRLNSMQREMMIMSLSSLLLNHPMDRNKPPERAVRISSSRRSCSHTIERDVPKLVVRKYN